MGPTLADNDTQVVGFIDIGTYSVRLLLVRFNPNLSHTILSEVKEPSRLGAGEIFEQRLEQEAMRRAAVICNHFADMARSFGADPIVAVATAATRDARNKRQFIRLLRKQAGINVNVISGKEEARLIYLGVSRSMHLGERNALFVDVGGGSTELAVGDEHAHQHLDSVGIGAIRLSQAYNLNRADKPIGDRQYKMACHFVRSAMVAPLRRVKKQGFELCVASSGTALNLGGILAKGAVNNGGPLVIQRAPLRDAVKRLCSLPLEQRRAVPGLNPARADIILGGAAIIETLMDDLKIDRIETSTKSLRDGLLIDHQIRLQPDPKDHLHSTRRQSVLLLGRRCGFDEQHARHVVGLTLQLFDSARDVGMHNYGPPQRELIEYAAWLHDIGVFLSFQSHHLHTYYLVRHADLIGFDNTEIGIIAALARFHRKGLPRKTQHEVAELSDDNIKLVAKLCVLLRVAESLDRSHAALVTNVRFERSKRKTVSLLVESDGDCTLELWRVQKQKNAFKKVYGERLSVHLARDQPNAAPADQSATGSTL